MDLDPLPLATAFGLLIALIGIWRSEQALNRTKDSELHLLRQNVRLKAEAVLSEWHKLNRENDTLIHRLALNDALPPELRTTMADFLQDWKEHLGMCVADASADAKDAHANYGNYSKKECLKLLGKIDVSIEVLKRNQGESKRKFDQLMERAGHHSAALARANDA